MDWWNTVECKLYLFIFLLFFTVILTKVGSNELQWGKKVCSWRPIMQVLPCNFPIYFNNERQNEKKKIRKLPSDF